MTKKKCMLSSFFFPCVDLRSFTTLKATDRFHNLYMSNVENCQLILSFYKQLISFSFQVIS